MVSRLLRTVPIVGLACVASSCDADLELEPTSFETLFEEVARVQLEERPDDPIVDIARVTIRPGGGYLIPDEAAGRVRVFDAAGRLERTLARPGEGPGELDAPTAAVELTDGSIAVVQRGDPRLTVFPTRGEPRLRSVPGQYGFWLAPFGPSLVAGVGSRTDRFALLEADGDVVARFGAPDPRVNEIPYWIFFAREHGAVLEDRIIVNTGFFARLRVFDAGGIQIDSFGTTPPSWVQAEAPPVDRIRSDTDRALIDTWSRSFTVVRSIAAVGDQVVVVQYGQFEPTALDPYHTVPSTIDVYDAGGVKLLEDVRLDRRVVGDGPHLVVVSAEPPNPWTLSAFRVRALSR